MKFELWQLVSGGIVAVFGGGGVWAYLKARLDTNGNRITYLEGKLEQSDKEHDAQIEKLRDEMAEISKELASEKGRRRSFEDLILFMVKFQMHDQDAWMAVVDGIQKSREDPNFILSADVLLDRRRKRIILVVDDEVGTTDMLSVALKMAGYDVRTANNGADALQQFTTMRDMGHRPDLVLLDWSMPKMNGGDVAIEIRAHEAPGSPPVRMVFLTGNAEDIPEATLKQIGAMKVIKKPVDIDDLNRTLQAILRA